MCTAVEWTFVRDSEGLKIGLLRLQNTLEITVGSVDKLTRVVAKRLRTSPLARALEPKLCLHGA